MFSTNDASGKYFPERYFLYFNGESDYYETIEVAAKVVSDIVGHKIEANFDAVFAALDLFVKQHEEEEPDLFFIFNEIKVSPS